MPFGVDGYVARVVARTLIAFMLFQPVYVAFGAELDTVDSLELTASGSDEFAADEEHDSLSSAQEEETSTETPASESESESEIPVEAPSQVDADVQTDTVESQEPPHGEESETREEQVVEGEDSEDTTSDMPPLEVSTDEDGATGEGDTVSHASGTDIALHATGTDASTVSSSTVDTADEPVEESAGEDDTEVTPVTLLSGQGDSKYTFGEGDCTLVAEGEFYCVTPTTRHHADADPRVYAEKDREGDREIFYFDGAEVVRITNNSYDDFAPVFDNDSRRIVWQASVFDRTQIMVHDLTEKTTRQITSGKQNSSNPDILGDWVVWQEWVDTNWEVMMTDVDTTGEYVVERLTDNAVHDMFPQLFDGMVTWQHEQGASWEVIVHDLKTGKEHALQKNEDTKYENPRFVLLFDSTHTNGDVETIGYDLDSGEMMELGTKANPQPVVPVSPKEEIPDAPVAAASSTALKVSKEGEGGEQ